MKLEQVLQQIESVSSALTTHGVTRIAVFGSVSRGEAEEDSDIDILIDLDPEHETLADLVAVAELLEQTLGVHVDVVTRNGLSQYVLPFVEAEARYAEIT